MQYLVPLGVLLVLSAFVSAAEIAVTMASRVRMRTRVESGSRRARLAEKLLARPERAIVTCLVGVNLANVGAAVYGSEALAVLLPLSPGQVELVSIVTLVPLLLLFGEIVPKALAQTYPNRSLLALAAPLHAVRIVLWPLIQVNFAVAELVRRLARMPSHVLDFLSREELKQFVAQSEKHGHVDEEERDLIHQIFEFWKRDPLLLVRPLKDVPRLPVSAPAGRAKETMRAQRLSRLVVTDDADADVVGVLSATALLDVPNDGSLSALLLGPVRAELSAGVDRLFSELQRSPSQIAVVASADGTGVVLLDDLLTHLLGRQAPLREPHGTREQSS